MNINDTINDCCVDVFGKKPTKKMIKYIRECLPYAIIIGAEEWGADDTLIWEETYKWIGENISSMETLKYLSE